MSDFDITKIKGIEPLVEKAPADSSLNNESKESPTEKKEEVITDKPKEEIVKEEKPNTEESTDDKPKEEKSEGEKPAEEIKSEDKPKEEKSEEAIEEEKEVVAPRKVKEVFDDLNDKFEQAHNISLIQAIDIVNTDYDTMNETDVIAAAIILNDPDISQEELDFAINKFDVLFKDVEEQKRMIAEGEISEKEHKALDVEYTKLLRTSKSTMKAFQDEIKTKLESAYVPGSSEQKQTDNSEDIAKQLSEQIAPVLSKYQSESFDITDKDGKVIDTIKIDLDDTDRKIVSDIMNGDVTGVFKMWMKEDGTIDLGKMVRSIYRDREFERISKITYNQGLAKGQLSQVKEQSNLDFEKKDHPGETKEALDPNLARILKDLKK